MVTRRHTGLSLLVASDTRHIQVAGQKTSQAKLRRLPLLHEQGDLGYSNPQHEVSRTIMSMWLLQGPYKGCGYHHLLHDSLGVGLVSEAVGAYRNTDS